MENNTKFRGTHLFQNRVSSNLTNSVEPHVKTLGLSGLCLTDHLEMLFQNMYYFLAILIKITENETAEIHDFTMHSVSHCP